MKFGFAAIPISLLLVLGACTPQSVGEAAKMAAGVLSGKGDEARVEATRTDVHNLMQVLKLYKLDNLRYPTDEQGLQALVAKPTIGPIPPNWRPYLDKLPNDAWNSPYQYANPGLKGEIDVYSFGADGVVDGEGKNADIGSWQ